MLDNILVISSDFPDEFDINSGGIFVKEQLQYIKKYFNKVYVICPIPFGIEYLRKIKYYNYQFENVKVFFPRYINCPLFYFYFRNIWVHLETQAILKLIKEKDINYDLIHAHFTWPSGAVAIALKKIMNVPVVITEHTSATFNKAILRHDPIYKQTWTDSNAIIRVRRNDIHLFKNAGVPLDKVFYIPNGFNHKKFQHKDSTACRKKLGLPVNKKIILNVGNMYDEVKGHKYLISAMNEIVKRRKDVLCVIVGSGKLKDKMNKQIVKAGLENHVKLVGGKPHDEIPTWMGACDVFVLPSLNEGNPTVMFECLACGKPFIGTKVGGIPEVIDSGEYGLLCDPANSDDLAEMILVALEKKWDREKIKIYAKRFTWDNIAKQIIEIYENVVSQKPM